MGSFGIKTGLNIRVFRGLGLRGFYGFALIFAVCSSLLITNITKPQNVEAATSSTLNFQARLRNSSGAPVPDGSYNIEFKLYNAANPDGGETPIQGACTTNPGAVADEDCLWVETRTGGNTVTVRGGYFSVNLGSVNTFPGTINWDQDLWLSMEVGGMGTPAWDGEMSPRFKLTAVPYAFRAGALMNAAGTAAYDADDLAQLSPSVIQLLNTTGSALRINQTGTGGLLQLQGNGTDVFTVDNTGSTVLGSGITVGNSSSTAAGTIRWNGSDLEGYDGSSWVSLTSSGSLRVNPQANVRKTADETQNSTVNATAALQNDDELAFSIGANEVWTFRFVVTANANATPDIKFAVTAPSGATCRVGVQDAEGATTVGNLGCGVSSGLVPGNTAEDIYEVTGTIVNGANAGPVTLQWAQNTANVANVIVRQGSYLVAQRVSGPTQTAEAFIQNGNSFGADAVLGTNDNQALIFQTNGTEKARILSNGNFGIGDNSPAALFTVGTNDALQVTAAGNVSTSGTLAIGGLSTFSSSLVANMSTTGVTGTTSGTGTNTTALTLAADSFNANDIILIDNAGQDYYTRIVTDNADGTYVVSPAVTFENGRTVTAFVAQNIGATASDYTTNANRFFQGYFLGGVVIGSGTTTLSDGSIDSSVDLRVQSSGGLTRFGGAVTVDGILTGNGSGLTNLSGSAIDGSTITALNASNISSGTLADARLSSNVALLSGTQSFTGLKTFGAGLTITAGQSLTVNSESFTDLTGTGLTLNSGSLEVVYGSTASSAVRGDTVLTCPSGSGNLGGGGTAITLGSGGTCSAITITNSPAFTTSVTSPSFTGTGAVTFSSGGGSALTIDSASGTIIIAADDTTLQRTAAGSFNIELNNAAATTLVLNNTGAGAASLNLSDGGLQTAGTSRLNNAGALENITGLTITSGGAAVTGASQFADTVNFNGNTTIGNATTDRLTITSQLLNQDALVFQGATDNSFATTLRITEPTANRIITLPDLDGAIALIGTSSAQVDASTNTSFFINKTGASGNILTLQKNAAGVFTIANSGAVSITVTDTSAFNVANAGGTSYFSIDTSGALVRIGSATADGVGALLILDTKNTAGDPTIGSENNAQYYNSATNKIRCYENGAWSDCMATRVTGEATLGVAGNTITVNLSQSTEYLTCRLDVKGRTLASVPWVRFNSDTGIANYSWNIYGITAAAVIDAQDNSDSEIEMATATSTVPFSAKLEITNFADTRKAISWEGTGADPIGTNLNRFSGGGVWANTANQITSVQFVASTGNFTAGSHAWCEGRNVP